MNQHEPRPEIERHHHIQELIDRQEIRAADRQYHRDRAKALEERNEEIANSDLFRYVEFWCDNCKEDFLCPAIRQVEQDWSNSSQLIAYYRGKHHVCGTWAIRHITDKWKDAYWTRSEIVNRERGKFHDDLLQPYEEGFNLLYGKFLTNN